MNFKVLALTSSLATALATASLPTLAQELTISVSNLTHGVYFTPLLVAAHDSNTFAFHSGTAASDELATQAEGGNPVPLKTLLEAAGADTSANPVAAEAEAGTIAALPDGNPGFLAPGKTTSLELSTTDSNNLLSVTAMILPTNDGFIGLDSWNIPTTPGTYSINLNAYDAGTEANDEILVGEDGGALGVAGIPGCPGGACGTSATGAAAADQNTNVHIHRNTLGDFESAAGKSDLDSSVHRWLNPVARITVVVK
jgi:hypothetical protein